MREKAIETEYVTIGGYYNAPSKTHSLQGGLHTIVYSVQSQPVQLDKPEEY
jgi:hypothetical protein